jgi:hypothetical protein
MPILKFKKLAIPKSAFGIWRRVFVLVVSEPKILVPFGALAVAETFTLWCLASSPHFPLSIILAPPIKSIWGPVYLHYPYIYELLPKVFYYAKIVVGIFVGSVTSGMAVLAIARSSRKDVVDIKKIFFDVLKRYLTLFILAIILFTSVHFVMKQPQFLFFKYFRTHPKLLFIGPKFWFTVFLPVLTFVLAVVLQALFVYSIPSVVIKGKKFLVALWSGIRIFFKTLIRTLFAVLIPMILYIPVTMLRSNLGVLADKFTPESVMVVMFIGILAGTVIVDCLVTVATTLIFLEVEHEK